MSELCEHFVQAKDESAPKTKGCEECEKEKLPWVAIRMKYQISIMKIW